MWLRGLTPAEAYESPSIPWATLWTPLPVSAPFPLITHYATTQPNILTCTVTWWSQREYSQQCCCLRWPWGLRKIITWEGRSWRRRCGLRAASNRVISTIISPRKGNLEREAEWVCRVVRPTQPSVHVCRAAVRSLLLVACL